MLNDCLPVTGDHWQAVVFMRKSCMKSLCGLLTLEGSAGAVGGDEPALCKETLTKN